MRLAPEGRRLNNQQPGLLRTERLSWLLMLSVKRRQRASELSRMSCSVSVQSWICSHSRPSAVNKHGLATTTFPACGVKSAHVAHV